jgi:hypothetical protein
MDTHMLQAGLLPETLHLMLAVLRLILVVAGLALVFMLLDDLLVQ